MHYTKDNTGMYSFKKKKKNKLQLYCNFWVQRPGLPLIELDCYASNMKHFLMEVWKYIFLNNLPKFCFLTTLITLKSTRSTDFSLIAIVSIISFIAK